MIRIMTDAAADIPAALAKELEIEVLPFMIHLGDKSICADIDLEPETYYQLLRESDAFPSTSQMSPADLEDRFRSLGADGDSILYISISSKGSGIHNTACMVAEQLKSEGFDITVLDSTMFSYVIGKTAVEAAQMAKAGKSKEEIIAYATEVYHRDTAYFVVDDLSYLKKGGRIKATTMAIGTMLDIKPILNINDGLVEAYRKVRGLKKAMSVLVDYAEERMDDPQNNEVIILHSDAPDKVEILKQMVENRINPASITVEKVGPIITSHAGLGVVGIFFKHKKPYEEYETAE
ncbi:MAG: DegV family protein [Clostridia bacterium]|nr:DegV family protein [Clostridia bacterium]